MHERPFTQKIVGSILASLKDYPEGRVTAARVSVGEIYHLVPESVRTHFESLIAGTPLEGARLDLVEVPLQVRCKDCGQAGSVEDHHAPLCAACGSLSVENVAGHEIRVEDVALTVPEGTGGDRA
jgi:hydrogenase nickel incorporation protein HypA/HybF